MSIFAKSILSLLLLAQVMVALFSMMEVMGREKSRFNPRVLRLIHRINGYIFIGIFIVLSYFCLPFLTTTPVEISARALIHSLLAIGVISMLAIKILFIRSYRRHFSKASTFGLTIFFLSLGLVATSGGYYLVTSAEVPPINRKAGIIQTGQPDQPVVLAKNEQSSQEKAQKGERLFNKWCFACHDPNTTVTKVAPGLKGVLKNEKLPASGREATPENIRRQLRTPYRLMPPQTHLNNEDINYIIEFLKTL